MAKVRISFDWWSIAKYLLQKFLNLLFRIYISTSIVKRYHLNSYITLKFPVISLNIVCCCWLYCHSSPVYFLRLFTCFFSSGNFRGYRFRKRIWLFDAVCYWHGKLWNTEIKDHWQRDRDDISNIPLIKGAMTSKSNIYNFP